MELPYTLEKIIQTRVTPTPVLITPAKMDKIPHYTVGTPGSPRDSH